MAQDQDLFTDEELKNIIDGDLLDLLGAKNMSDDEKLALYEKMTQTLQDRVLLRVDDALNDEDQKIFSQLVTEGDQAKINEFLLSRNIEVPKLLVEEALIYKVEIMSLMKLSKQKTDDKQEG